MYKTAVCVLEDITSPNPVVSLAEPRALRLSRRQARGGECIRQIAMQREGRQGREQQGDGKITYPLCDLRGDYI